MVGREIINIAGWARHVESQRGKEASIKSLTDDEWVGREADLEPAFLLGCSGGTTK